VEGVENEVLAADVAVITGVAVVTSTLKGHESSTWVFNYATPIGKEPETTERLSAQLLA